MTPDLEPARQSVGTAPVTELLARASSREELRPGDGRSGSAFQLAVVDGRRYFLKRLSPSSDWIMRVIGDHVHWPYLVWREGIMDRAPATIDHTVVAMELDGTGDDAVLSILMHDVAPHLVPEGDATVPFEQHRGFLAHMADLAATFWGWEDTIGLSPVGSRFRFFAPDNIAAELLVDDVPGPIAAADAGWKSLPERSPLLWRLATWVHDDPDALAAPLRETPITFLHGDWKMGNLGTHPAAGRGSLGRTILLDWAYPGSGPACWDLCWYLALNRARLPEPKEAAIARFRAALEDRGVETTSWWQSQLDLCLAGIMATFGWEKALGDEDELRWWEEQVSEAVGRQGLDVPR